MQLDKYLVTFILFSLFVVGGYFVLGDLADNYDIVVDEEYESVYNTMNETFAVSQDIKDDVLGGEVEGGDASWESLIKSSYSALRLVRSSFSLIGNILNTLARELNIPTFIVTFALTALLITILFAIIYLIFRFKG